ncbi:MAG: tetratricopeptide repeat protein [Holophaga sp.]|nr:tetratricopeptide repeat protein [Holophaga sp.]
MLLFPSRMRSAFLVLAVLATLGAQESDMAERLFRSGERAYAAKSYPEALETWGQLLQQAPTSGFAAQALLRMANHQLEQEHKPEAALPLLERVKTEHMKTPWAADAMLLRGQILATQARKPQDLRDAVGEFNRVVDLFPDHPALQTARYHLGLAAKLQGQWARALQHFTDAIRLDPTSPVAPKAQFQAAEVLDVMGDLSGCLRLLQSLRNQFPQSPEASEAAWRIAQRVKFRIQKPPLRSEGPWPQGKTKWLKTPTLLSTNANGEIVIYQDDLDQAFVLRGTELTAIGPVCKSAKALALLPDGTPCLLSAKTGISTAANLPPIPVAGLSNPSGLFQDAWQNFWVSDAKAAALSVVEPTGTLRSLPSPATSAMAALPNGGAVVASDANRSLLFLDASAQPRLTVPYGKDLPAPFKYVVALSADPTGHVVALVDGDFEGVVLWGPNGSLLRFATFKELGLNGKFRAVTLDRQGGIILADRSNDLLIRLN